VAEVICLGELLIDFVPTVTGVGLAGAETFRKAAGGAPANVAVGLARLGVSSAFLGMVGEDGFGHFLADTLREAGVDVGQLRFTKASRTALAFVSLAADGDREFLFYRDPGADTLLSPDDISAEDIASAKMLHYGSISLIGEPSASATMHAVALARRLGVRRSYDPNLREALWPGREAARAGLRRGLQEAEIVKISEEEVSFLSGRDEIEAGVRALWHDELLLVAVTRGRAGSCWFTRDSSGAMPGFTVAAIDATGAGDAFMAGLLAGLIERPAAFDYPVALNQICLSANAAGALATTIRGAIPAMPDRAAVAALMGQSSA